MSRATGKPIGVPKSVFITGASGFIGRALRARFKELGAEVRGMDLRADPSNQIVAGDLVDPGAWSQHAAGCELFINTAAVVSLAADWQKYRDSSVRGVRCALDIAIAGGAKRFVHFSSIAALGYDYPDGADERTPVVIGDEYRYGVAKGASEQVVLAAHAAGEIECTIIRPGDVYGPESRAWIIEPLKMAKAGQLLLPDGGQGVFTPIYIDDLVDGTVQAACLTQAIGHIFILWGGEAVSCRDFFANHWRWAGRTGNPRSMSLAAALVLTKLLWRLDQKRGGKGEVTPDIMRMLSRRGTYSIEKARRVLGFDPKVSLAEGMKRSEAWLRETGMIK